TQAARQSYASAIQLNPAGTQAYLSLLPLQLAAGDLAAAETTLAALEKVDAKAPLTSYYKAWLKLERGQLAQAQELGEGLLKR
ncbi:hypothetical protein NL446_26815, partial [Klebsiella pneumoniae]|nr:hypothetical protein [Klebsiella pneumoniae]